MNARMEPQADEEAKQWRLSRILRVAWLAGFCGLAMVAQGAGSEASRFHQVDLAAPSAAFSNAPSPPLWKLLPKGQHSFNGVPFKIDGRIAVTGLNDAREGVFHPAARPDVPLRRKAGRLHLLLGTDGDEKEGVPLAKVSVHYANGQERSLRISYGVHVRSWLMDRRERHEPVLDPGSTLAWSSASEESERPGTKARLYQTTFANPLPKEEITRLELISLFSRSTPFLCGLTLEPQPVPELAAGPVSRVIGKSLELPDTAYHDHLVFRVRDAQGGGTLRGASAALSLSDDEATFYFGRADADGAGVVRLPFPPQQTVGYAAVVKAPGRVPMVLSSALTNGGPLQREFEVRLERGTRLGGLVQDAQGKPLAGAEVAIYQATLTGPRDYIRVDHDTTRTGPDGRWTSESVPPGFTNFNFYVSHEAHRGRLFRQDGTTLSAEILQAGKAVLVLPGPLVVGGMVLDGEGKPLPKAEVRLLSPDRSETATTTTTDGQGLFTLRAEHEGENWVSVTARGHASRTQSIQISDTTPPLQVRLAKSQPFRGRVVDQNGQGVAGARVRLEDRGGAGGLSSQTLTDENGRFVWESPPENEMMFFISATNYGSTRVSFGSSSSGEHMIQLRKQSRVSGQVVDAETGKPIEEFQVVRGRSYNLEEPMRWERYDSVRGRRGTFSMRLEEYSSARSQVLIEAPGYVPQASPVYRKAGVYTNDFRLIKGRGISGVVERTDGTPVPGVTVALVDSGESVGMEKAGELRRSGSGPAFQRSNPGGRFEFPPKYDPHTILAASAEGFAQAPASNVAATGKLILQPWGRVQGVLRVPAGAGPARSLRLQSGGRYAEEGRAYAALDLSVTVNPDAAGNFAFDKAPPGERKVFLHYRLGDRESGRIALSHGVPVTVRPNATAQVVIGGKGRRVIGRVVPMGADPEDLDWLRDVQQMTSVLALPPTLQSPTYTPNMTQEQQQEAWQEYNQRQAQFWRTPEGQKLERQQRSYVLLFETNGTFRVENVEPGQYYIHFHITNPERGQNSYETIGSQSVNVTVPEGGPEEVFDVGPQKLPIRGMMRVGRKAPQFEVTAFDGKQVKLDDFRGKYVLLDFWATWAGTRSLDVRILKELNETYGKDPRFALVGFNFDPERKEAERVIEQSGLKWLQCALGNWGSTDLPGSFGVQGLPEALLIDPEGKIVAKGLRGSNIRNTVRNQLGPAQR